MVGDHPRRPLPLAGDGVLVSERPHGTYVKYVVDRCRCDACRTATREYERRRKQAHRDGNTPYVPAGPVREWVTYLQGCGVGAKRIAEVSGVSHGALSRLIHGTKDRPPSRQVRRSTRDRILAVTPRDAADSAKIDSAATWRLIGEMLDAGATRVSIARALGQTGQGLQLSEHLVRASTAAAVRDLHAAWHAGDVTLRTRGHRNRPSRPVSPPSRTVTPAERQARHADTDELYDGIIRAVTRRGNRDWRGRAACRGCDTNMWFPAKGDYLTPSTRAALSICASCPVRNECAAEAADNHERNGIWGGASVKRRRQEVVA